MARRISLFTICTLSLFLGFTTGAGAEQTIGSAFERYRAELRKQPQVVSLDGFSDSFMIPAAGAVRGGGNTFFRTDLSIYNHNESDQEILIGFMSQGVDNTTKPMVRRTIEGGTWWELPNVVETVLHDTGLGTIVVFGVNGEYFDKEAELTAFSRIWTPQPGSTGTVSQSFASVDILDHFSSSPAYGLGLVQDASYRTNVGVVNLDDSAQQVEIHAIGMRLTTEMTMTVPPYSMMQQPIPAGDYGQLILYIPRDSSASMWFSAYASSVDNRTGDGWVSHFVQP